LQQGVQLDAPARTGQIVILSLRGEESQILRSSRQRRTPSEWQMRAETPQSGISLRSTSSAPTRVLNLNRSGFD